MNRKNRLTLIILAATAIVALGVGLIFKPALAQNPEVESFGDRLIGVFVTKDYVDNFDFDKFVADNGSALLSGTSVVSPKDSLGYQKKIYAVRTVTPLTEEEGGGYSYDYSFDGYEGLRCFTVQEKTPQVIQDATGEFVDEDYITHVAISEMECSTAIRNESSDGDFNPDFAELELDCNLYAFADGHSETLGMYCNPVYQDSDGNVYMLSGQCILTSNDELSIGAVLSCTLDDTYEEKASTGESVKEKSTVKVHLNIVSPPADYIVSRYTSAGELIDNKKIAAADMPSEIRVSDNCDYVVVTGTDKSGKTGHTLVDKESSDFTYYEASDKSYADKKTCKFIWP